jgi:hypothetical protein
VQRYVVAAVVSVIGCNDAITLEVASDRPIPRALDAICVGVADTSLHGGQFGQVYRLEGRSLPQTLRVSPGSASAAWAWVRGDRGGVPVLGAGHAISFAGDVTLGLPSCVTGPAGAAHMVGNAIGPAAAKLVASQGPGGTLVVAVTPGGSIVIDGHDGLTMTQGPVPPAGAPVAVITADLDGDCDDDLVIATDGAPPMVMRRDQGSFIAGDPIGTSAVVAIAAADVDRDGHVDLVLGVGASLQLWRNDGAGKFTHDPNALSGAGRVVDVRALALGDLDGDGNPDLVVGQAGQMLEAWLGDAGGAGSFNPASAVVPPVPLDVEQLALTDVDGDFDPDLAVSVRGAAMRLYIDRDGLLEDQSFVRLPQPAPITHAIAFGGWDDGCEPDGVIASDAGAPSLRGQPTGTFAADTAAPGATDVVMVDIDDDGDLDAILATPQGVVWLAR